LKFVPRRQRDAHWRMRCDVSIQSWQIARRSDEVTTIGE
jgi:hypothetical protein